MAGPDQDIALPTGAVCSDPRGRISDGLLTKISGPPSSIYQLECHLPTRNLFYTFYQSVSVRISLIKEASEKSEASFYKWLNTLFILTPCRS